jgi:hypothetical protein
MTTAIAFLLAIFPKAQTPPEEGGLDRVALHGGSGVVGSIVRVNPREIFIRIGSAEVGIPRSAIAHIEWGRAGEWDPYRGVRLREEEAAHPSEKGPAEASETPRPEVGPVPGPKPPLRTPPIAPALKAKIDSLLGELRKAGTGEQQRLVEELAKTGEAGQIYLAAILSDHEPIADPIVSAILVNPAKGGFPYLVEQLPRVGDGPKSRILAALGSRGYVEAEQAVAEALASKSDEVRLAAVNALAAFGNPRWAARILETLETAPPALAERAVEAVAVLAPKDEAGVRAEAEFRALQLCRAAAPAGRANGARLAGRLRMAPVAAALRDLILDESALVRAEAVVAVKELLDLESIEILSVRATAEEDQWVKIQIAQALGRILKGKRDFRPLPGLIALLRDENEQVRNRASQALMEITGERLGHDAEAWETWYRERVGGR